MSETKQDQLPAQTTKSLGGALADLQRMSHAGVVIVTGAILDQSLERAIRIALPNTNNQLRSKLFSERGPLNTFAAKIDMAHGLGITSTFIYEELTKIRKIRNEFAHSDKLLSLDQEPIKTMFYGLMRPPGLRGDYSRQFMACVIVIDDYIEKYLYRMGDRGEHLSLRFMKQNPANGGSV